jgi:RNA polymerase sigma factor (sigma-70 family)
MRPGPSPTLTGFTSKISYRGLKLFCLSPLRLPVPPLGLRGLKFRARNPIDSRAILNRFPISPPWPLLGSWPLGLGGRGADYSEVAATFQRSGASNQSVARLIDIDIPPDVLASARFGSERAQAAIYAALAPATFGLIRRLVGSRALAEDLFQDSMMAVFQGLGTYRAEAPLGAWARQIAVSKCLMYLRSPWHRARLRITSDMDVGTQSVEALLPVTPGPLAESLDVERALASLAPTARAVVWLFEVEGYSHEEIAQSFGRSISFSKSQLARAHVKLREWFEPRMDRQTCTTL